MSALRTAARLGLAYFMVVAAFERLAPRRVVRAYQRLNNNLQRPLMGLLPGWAVLETRGHRTGKLRQTPVGGRRIANSFWLVAGDGRASSFVQNLEADPTVRVRYAGRWRAGRARVVEADNAPLRALRVNPFNGAFVLVANPRSAMLSIEVQLVDDAGARASERMSVVPKPPGAQNTEAST